MIPEHCVHAEAVCGPELYVAVTKQARQAGRFAGGKNPAPAKAPGKRWPPGSIISGPSRVPAAAPPDSGSFERLADDQHTGLILVYGPVSMIWVPQQHI
jgi:hypothetical protein